MIYQIKNKQTGDVYIGKTNDMDRRWKTHLYNAENHIYDTYLYRAMRKYGIDSFEMSYLCEGDSAEEIEMIAKHDPKYNMTPGGDGGWINDQTGNTWKVKDSSKMGQTFRDGNNHSEAWRSSVTGGNNYQCIYEIHTPWGVFDTWISATTEAKKLREQGRRDVVTDKKTLTKYCKEDIVLSAEGRRTFPQWRGKCTTDLGFYVRNKDGSDIQKS